MPDDSSTTSRVLRLLSLLQSHRYWSGPELADHLGVTGRTLRRDVERLRELGYRVNATRGTYGGYQLDAGSDLPPMIFSSDEAVALAVGLRLAVSSTAIAGMAETTVGAYAKLEQVLPARLRARVRALQQHAVSTRPISDGPQVDPESLSLLALACRDRELVRFAYTAADGAQSSRRVEPQQLVQHDRYWYLVAWDLDRDDWRTLRLDRVAALVLSGARFAERSLPPGGAASMVTRGHADTGRVFSATIRIAAPVAVALDYLGGYTNGLSADGDEHTTWEMHSDRVEILAGALMWLPWPYEVIGSAELVAFLQQVRDRLSSAV